MKNLMVALALLLTWGPLHAESEEEWTTRRRRELLDEGKSLLEVRRIMEEEAEARAKAVTETPTTPPNAQPKEDDPKGSELKALESEWKDKLEKKGFKGSELDKALAAEMTIQKKLLTLPEKERPSESNNLHVEQACKHLKESSILKGYPSSYVELVAKEWKDWLHVPSAEQKKLLESACKDVEEKEIKKRKAKSTAAMNETRRDLKSYWLEKSYHQGAKAEAYFTSAWEMLINTPAREYNDARAEQKEKLKRNGFDPESIKIFFAGIDPLFEE
ncbi:MAG: hypothetical protein AB7F75_09320 [Planctomycetota bacterium]